MTDDESTQDETLTGFESGWADGWAGRPKEKGRNAHYNNAYDKARAARKEADFYDEKRHDR